MSILAFLDGYKNFKVENYKILAKYFLTIKGDIKGKKINDVSNDTYISGATIIRFCKFCSTSGFSEFKYKILEEIQEDKVSETELELNKTTREYLEKVKSSLDEASEKVNNNDVDKCIDLLKNAQVINIFATGETNIIASEFAQKIIRIGKQINCEIDRTSQYLHSLNNSEKAVSIGISLRGENEEVIKNLKNSKKNGATTIFISSKNLNEFDHEIFLPITKEEIRYFSTSSRINLIFLLDIIFLGLIEKSSEEYKEKLRITRKKS